jgi:hypothetical protein
VKSSRERDSRLHLGSSAKRKASRRAAFTPLPHRPPKNQSFDPTAFVRRSNLEAARQRNLSDHPDWLWIPATPSVSFPSICLIRSGPDWKSPRENSCICGGFFDVPAAQKRLGELNDLMAADGFWNNREKAQSLIDEANTLRNKI